MKKLIVLCSFILFLSNSYSQTFYGSGGLIPDDGSSVSFQINVTGLSPSILNTTHGLAMVTVNLIHPYDSDLQFSLVASNGDRVLLSYANGWDGDNYLNTHFTDTASLYIVQGTAPFSGYYRPQEILGNMNDGRLGNGIWKLEIQDMYAYADQGTLLNWSITFGNNPTGPFEFTSSNLPIVLINTNGQDIPDDPKIPVGMKIIDNGPGVRNQVTDTPVYDAFAGIEIRGSSSQMFPKKSYGFETWDENGEELEVSLLGMPEESDWILNASYTDKTLIRNALAYQTFRDLDNYATRYKYVEVVINEMYKGVYIFSEKIKRDGDRVDIAKLTPEQNTGDELTGGYIFKVDKMTGSGGDGWTSMFLPPYHDNGQTIYFQYEFPKSEDITLNQKTYIQNYVNTFENVLSSPNFDDPVNGFRKYAMEGTFIDYLIVNEISKNVDGYRLSTFVHKQRESLGGKLRMGPVWDYDIAFHNSNYCDGPEYTGWAYQFPCHDDYWQIPFWWERMLEDENFDNNLKCRWLEKRLTVLSNEHFDNYIDSIAGLLEESQQRNFMVWPILGVYVWPNPEPIPLTYAAEVSSLKDWMHNRLSWIDSNLPGVCNSVGIDESSNQIVKIHAYPNPVTERLFVDIVSETILSPQVELINALGQILRTNPITNSNGGITTFVIDAESLTSGFWMLRISSGNRVYLGNFIKSE
jgi:subtilisin-like proprotein convertase family protein